MPSERVEGPAKCNEVAGNQLRALVDELVERMLPVGSGLAPEEGSRLIIDRSPVKRHMLAVRLHRELLQISRKPLEILIVGENTDGLRAEKIVVPDSEQTHQNGQVPVERRGAKMFVYRVEAGEHRAEVVGANRDHRRDTDRRVHRITSTDPVPESEHVVRIYAELRDLARIGRDRYKMSRDRFLVTQRAQTPLARGLRIGHRLERRERFRRDDEERFRRVEVASRFGEIGAVDIRNETDGQAAIAIVPQRLVRHHRAEVRAADADIDAVANSLAGVTFPFATTDTVRELRHPVEHLMYAGHDVFAVDDD